MLHYVRLHLSKLESAPPADLEEANGRDVMCTVYGEGPVAENCSQPSGTGGLTLITTGR